MNKYFEPDEKYILLEESPKKEDLKQVEPIPDNIDEWINYVDDEINKIRIGDSELRKGALMISPNTPAMRRWSDFKKVKTPEAMRKFLEVATQDLTFRVAKAFQEEAAKYYPPARSWNVSPRS